MRIAIIGAGIAGNAAALGLSSRHDRILDFPAENFVAFFDNHRLLQLDRPAWRTVKGGSRHYVEKLTSTGLCGNVGRAKAWRSRRPRQSRAKRKLRSGGGRGAQRPGAGHVGRRRRDRARRSRQHWLCHQPYLSAPRRQADAATPASPGILEFPEMASQPCGWKRRSRDVSDEYSAGTYSADHPSSPPLLLLRRSSLVKSRDGAIAGLRRVDGYGFHEDGLRSGGHGGGVESAS
jgi:hypothetical protein